MLSEVRDASRVARRRGKRRYFEIVSLRQIMSYSRKAHGLAHDTAAP